MEIVTQEQMDKLNGLIEKYNNPEQVEGTVAGQVITITRYADVSALEKRKEKLITQEQCKNIVTAASALLGNNIPNVRAFAFFLSRNMSVFYFDPLCFMDGYDLTVLMNKYEAGIESLRHNVFIAGVSTEPEKYIDYNKIVETYTELTNFYEYIKKYPLDEDDVLKTISSKENY